MPEKINNIARNTSFFTFALILQKIISFTYFTLIARTLGPEDLGKYYFAISFAALFSVFIDFGLSNALTREIPKKNKSASQLLSNSLLIKALFSFITIIVVFLIVNVGDYSDLIKTLIYFSLICVILDSFSSTFFAVTRGFHNLLYESIASVIFQLIVLIFGLVVINQQLGLIWLIGSLISASTFNFFFSLSVLKIKWKLKLTFGLDKKILTYLLALSLPFALYAIYQRFYAYFDTVLLSHLATDRDVGIYQIAFKIVNALQFLPLAFTASLYPAMSSYWQNNREQLAITFERSIKYLLIIVLPISAGILILADKIILLFKEGFSDAVIPLQLNMVALIFIFLNYPVGSLLNACDRQKTNTKNMFITLIASIILNIILIPQAKSVGASLTVVFSNALMLILGLTYVPQIIKYSSKSIILIFLKTLTASILMALSVWLLKSQLSIFLVTIIGAFIYFLLLFFLGGIKKDDVVSIWRTFSKKQN